MERLVYKSEYFSPKDTLKCGQVFRFTPYKQGYRVISGCEVCYVYEENDSVIIETDNPKYFENYFDLAFDYSAVYKKAVEYGGVLETSANFGKGIRILRQNQEETLISFTISQNNNIPKITSSIEKLCRLAGRKISSPLGEYYAFPTAQEILGLSIEDLKSAGLGYRAEYVYNLAKLLSSGYGESLKKYSGRDLYDNLLSVKGIGDKVANCVMLFGYHDGKTFPVDTWIEKIYIDEFNGTIKDRKKITKYFIDLFGDYSGYFQQYLFYYKRSLKE